MAARITRSGRVVRLRLDRSWFWAKALAIGFDRRLPETPNLVPARGAGAVRKLLANP
jgi:hypothetical protein